MGVRGLLVTVVVAAVLPMLVMALLRANERAAAGREAAQARALELARGVADRLDSRVRHIRAVVAATARAVSPDPADSLRNDALLIALRQEAGAGYLTNLWVMDTAGRAIGTSRRPRSDAALVRTDDRLYFREALRTRRPAVGEPVRARPDTTVWSLTFAHPILDGQGAVSAVVLGTVGLSSLGSALSATELPAGSLVTLLDERGRVIGRSADFERWVGREIVDHPQVRQHMARGTGVADIVGLDGEARLAAFTRTTEVPWQVYAGLPPEVAYASSTAELRRDLLLLALALALALTTAVAVAGRLVRPLRALGDDALALAEGDARRRARADGIPELAALGGAFNVMAETVAVRTAQLHESERRYRQLFDASPLPLFVADADSFRFRAVNDAALAQYGYTRAEFLALSLTDIRPPEERLKFLMTARALREAHDRGDVASPGVMRHCRKDGSVIDVQAFTVLTEYDGRPAWATTALDITARRRTERALAESQERLRHAQKMESLGRFAGGIAHDFNNLLTGILGYCDLALDALAPADQAREDVTEIRSTARRAADLTSQILAFSGRQVRQPVALDLNEVVRGVGGVLERVAGERVALQLDLQPGLGSVLADRTQIERVLMNLVVNARDAMPDGGTLTISTAVAYVVDEGENGLAADERVRLSVSDTGTGMDASVLEHIFEPFFTTKPRGKGTGLGLATVDGIVQQSGGTIRVTSAPGEGSTFDILLPRGDQQVTTARPASPGEAAPMEGGDETILLVDDDDGVRALGRSILGRLGYAVLTAHDADDALALAAAYAGEIHLLVTDVMMPGLNGRELAERLVEARPGVGVLLVSGFTEDQSLHDGVSSRGLAFLAKPFTPAALARQVRVTLDAARPGPGAAAAVPMSGAHD